MRKLSPAKDSGAWHQADPHDSLLLFSISYNLNPVTTCSFCCNKDQVSLKSSSLDTNAVSMLEVIRQL